MCDRFADLLFQSSISQDSDVNLNMISSDQSKISENLRKEAKTAFIALAEARRLKKMVRFDGSRQSTKDSGIDMGSSICTSIEDSNTFFKVLVCIFKKNMYYMYTININTRVTSENSLAISVSFVRTYL